MRPRNKYGNRKVHAEGLTFDSKKEYSRWLELKLLQRAGEIRDLNRQVKFELIPVQKDGKRVIERACIYIADFVYTEGGEMVVEDVKGKRTADYIIKRKLMLWVHGIRIKEI